MQMLCPLLIHGVLFLIVIESVICDQGINLLPGDNILNFASNIINSETAEDGRYSYAQVSIQYPASANGSYRHQCGGSIIAPDIILTAAHCRNLIDRIYIDVYNVITDIASAKIYTAQNITIHPQFDKELFRYDFAIVHLNEYVDYIAPIRLNSDSSIPLQTADLTVLGWGAIQAATTVTNALYPSIMQKGYVQAMTNQNCESTVINGLTLYEGEIYEEMLCAEGLGVDACSGDSGGPLVLEGVSDDFDLLVGLVSWGRGCAVYPGVYSRISAGYDWIRSEVCYKSASPPSYMGCQPEERNPLYSIQPTLSPMTKPPVASTVSPVSQKPVSATPNTAAPITGIPTTKMPTRYPTSRPSNEPSQAPVMVVSEVFTLDSTMPSPGPSDGARAASVPQQQITSSIMDNNAAMSSSAKMCCRNSNSDLLVTATLWSTIWFVYR